MIHRDSHEVSLLATHLVVSEPVPSLAHLAMRQGESLLPALVYERGGCWVLVNEVSKDRASSRLTSSRLPRLLWHDVMYKYNVYCATNAFCTLRRSH